MKIIVLIFLLSLCFAFTDFDLTQSEDVLFEQFIKEYKKEYQNEKEKEERFGIFKETVKEIREKNSQRKNNYDAEFGINFYSDMKVSELQLNFRPSEPEMKREGNAKQQLKGKNRLPTFPDAPIPEQYFMCSSLTKNNTKRAKVDFCTTQMYQGKCGNCYAAAPANAAQFYYSNMTYYFNDKKAESVKPRRFTPQRWMDKVKNNTGTKRCCGGSSYWALHAEPTFTFLEDYPYVDENSDTTVCTAREDQNATVAIQMRLKSQVSFSVENNTSPEGILALKKLMYFYGPLNVNIKGSYTDFRNYKKGIYTFPENCQKQSSDHLLILLGYGKEDGQEFFLAKNTWYTGWGFEENYIKISTKRLCNMAYCPWENGNCENYFYFVGSCLLDKNCEVCNSTTLVCSKCKNGSTQDKRGMCVKPDEFEKEDTPNTPSNPNTPNTPSNPSNTTNGTNSTNSTNPPNTPNTPSNPNNPTGGSNSTNNKPNGSTSVLSLFVTFLIISIVTFLS